jgi:flagellar hook-associated protein 3 FlgL
MDLRVTMNTLLSRTLSDVRKNTDQLTRLQEEIAKNKRILRPSDDPFATASVMAGKAYDGKLGAFLDNIKNAKSVFDASGASLQEANNILVQARGMALEGANAVNDSGARQALAQQVDQLIGRLLDVANSKQDNSFLFGGIDNRTQPFQIVSRDAQGRPTEVAYKGQSTASMQTVSSNQQVAAYYPGDRVFNGFQRQTTVFAGDPTGAKPGTGTDSAIGQGTLLVRHVATTFAAGSGVQPGASSATGDNILGPPGAHSLVVNDTSGTGAAGVVSLDGGPAIAFTSADANLKVLGPSGQIAYLNMSAITPGFNGSVAITANGDMSLDQGATYTPIDFSANQTIADSRNGTVANIDSTQVRQTGTNRLDFTGTYDAFSLLIALRDDLRNTNGLNEADLSKSISGRVAEFDRVKASVLDALGEQSANAQNMESLQSHLENQQLDTKSRVATLEEPDIADLVVKMQGLQSMLQLSLAAYSKILDTSLLDYIK